MNFLIAAKTLAEIWLDGVTRAILILFDRLGSSRLVRIVEQDGGAFRFESAEPNKTEHSGAQTFVAPLGENLPAHLAALIEGAHVELILHPKHFLFRSLELPHRASDFLEGIIRAQFDRLTPWTADEAVFGYISTGEAGNGRISLTVAATSRSATDPQINALRKLGVRSLFMSTRSETTEGSGTNVKLLQQTDNIGGAFRLRLRRIVRFALMANAAVTLAAIVLAAVFGMVIGNEQDDVSKRIAAERATLIAERGATIGSGDARRSLEQRKRETPLSVILLEVLSRALPDDTYLTELRISGNKLQIVGMTRNAPTLISLIEKSSYFDRAIFFAPTTRSADDLRERFHIEATIKPGMVPLI